MGKTNTLTSHHPERNTHRADKMSGFSERAKDYTRGKSKKFDKKFAAKKRRALLKNIKNNKI